MTVEEARKRYEQYKEEIHWQNNHEHEDALFEVTEYLLNQTKDPWYSSDLGSYYYDRRQFDLALKYYEMTYELVTMILRYALAISGITAVPGRWITRRHSAIFRKPQRLEMTRESGSLRTCTKTGISWNRIMQNTVRSSKSCMKHTRMMNAGFSNFRISVQDWRTSGRRKETSRRPSVSIRWQKMIFRSGCGCWSSSATSTSLFQSGYL